MIPVPRFSGQLHNIYCIELISKFYATRNKIMFLAKITWDGGGGGHHLTSTVSDPDLTKLLSHSLDVTVMFYPNFPQCLYFFYSLGNS